MWDELSQTLASQRDAEAGQRAAVEKLINTMRPVVLAGDGGEGVLRFYETLIVSRALIDAKLGNANETLAALDPLTGPSGPAE